MPEVYPQIKGVLASKATSVTDAVANKIGDFRGDAAFNITTEIAEWAGQDYFVIDSFMTLERLSMNFAEVAYQPNKYALVFGLTGSVGTTKETTPVTASVFVFDTTWTGPANLEYLASMLRQNDANDKFQIWMYGIASADNPIALGHGAYASYPLGVTAKLDANNDIARIIFEN